MAKLIDTDKLTVYTDDEPIDDIKISMLWHSNQRFRVYASGDIYWSHNNMSLDHRAIEEFEQATGLRLKKVGDNELKFKNEDDAMMFALKYK